MSRPMRMLYSERTQYQRWSRPRQRVHLVVRRIYFGLISEVGPLSARDRLALRLWWAYRKTWPR